jgi:hypothetical protein
MEKSSIDRRAGGRRGMVSFTLDTRTRDAGGIHRQLSSEGRIAHAGESTQASERLIVKDAA